MTKKQAEQKIRELNRTLAKSTLALALSILECRSVDYKSYDDNYELPKLCVNAAQQRMKKQYFPLSYASYDDAMRIEEVGRTLPFPEDK